MANITRAGVPIHTNGELPAVGTIAPDFVLTDGDLNDVGLDAFGDRKKLLYIVPSLDTPTCARTTIRFNQEAPKFSNTIMLIVSADLPYAQKRFCSAEGTDRIKPLSMMRDRNFAKDYGVLIQDGALKGITARALLVLDESNRIIYSELVSEIKSEPDIDAALKLLD